jgi:5-methylcytosine-specific restriction endonuclease McrA
VSALGDAAREILDWLEAHDLHACLIGGLAVQRWGEPRLTQDVDLTVLAEYGKEEDVVDAVLVRRPYQPPRACLAAGARYVVGMATRSFRPSRRRRSPVPDVDALVREATEAARARAQGYRERSLALHGWICAKCAREFDASNLHLLTVHHKDGNNRNNPADGSNWENLCVDCHEDEHSRGLLGDYLRGDDD